MKKILFLGLLYILFSNAGVAQNIVLNEVLASNTSSIKDEDDSYQDWIELHNKGSVSVNLLGYGLSDDALLLFKWTFPNVSVAPGQYLLIWASDKNRSVAGSPLHTNFKISASGETILLTNASGNTIDTIPPANLQPDVSYGRLPNGTGPFVFFGTPTPNAANSSTGYSGVLSPPVFSQNSGFFTSGFNLTLSSLETETTILYTLDGSEPSENNLGGTTYTYKNQYTEIPGQATGPLLNNSYKTLQYSTPITIIDRSSQPNKVSVISSTYDFDPSYYFPDNPIFKGTIIRVKVIKPGYLASKVITKNYFISPQGSSKYTLPVIALSINEDRFYGYDNGIYVAGKDFDDWRAANPNGSARGSQAGNYYRETDDERFANMCYYVNGSEVINQDIGLKIRGGATRRYEKKSLTVYARSEYGDSTLDYKFFPDLPFTSYDRLTLSSSGWDFRLTKFRDALEHQLCKSLHAEIEAYQPAVAFVNGEYWGILGIRERYDNNYFERVYNTKAVDFLENNMDLKEGDAIHYNAMTNYVRTHSLANTSNFDYIKTQLDPESFSDFFITNIFFQNADWPNNNVQYWRNKISAYDSTAPYGLDGRWRWLLHDMDATFSFGTNDFNGNTLELATSINTTDTNPEWSTLLLRKMLENNTFKTDFINRFADLLNTSFLPARIISKMNEMKTVIAPEMPGEMTRWNVPSDLNEWQEYIDDQINFANARPALQRNHIRSVFAIASNINATLNVSGVTHGYIKMNTIDIIDGTPGITGNPYPWTGIYFKDIPVKLKAIAKPGFVFSHWSGASSSTTPEITITPTGNFSITANFIPDGPVETSVPIYFWMMDNAIVNGAQLTSLNSTYKLLTDGVIQYQSCIVGYPFISGNPSFGKASMERRNLPTNINYRPEANNNIVYSAGIMKGLQIKEPLQSGGLENTMIFNFSTAGYKKIIFSFAAINELTNASAISIDYAINSGTPVWITSGLTATSLPLTATYQLFQNDFSTITTVDNNPDFKVRLRFTGSNMTADTGARVTFNNIAVDGVKMPLSYPTPNVFNVGTVITNLTPSTTQTITGYSVFPSLPSGLILNATTGVISGTPTVGIATATYTVTANYSGGSLTFGVVITINAVTPPSGLSYNSPNVFIVGSPITNLLPSITGTVSSYGIAPSLPSGLSFNTSTGVISGTPTVISSTVTYTVTANNSGGSVSFGVVITVNDVAPNSLSYNSPNVFTKNTAIT
ncbi:CotH kinase family protein, partial [Flavobacterium psychrotolerans]